MPSATSFYESFDARDWATAWLETIAQNPSIPTDEGTMIAWFANALMRGYDEHARRVELGSVSSQPPAEPGLYGKFRVERTDGKSAPGEKHDGCEYFVLDLTHDPFALPAIRAYAQACRVDHPDLSRDLVRIVDRHTMSTALDRADGRR